MNDNQIIKKYSYIIGRYYNDSDTSTFTVTKDDNGMYIIRNQAGRELCRVNDTSNSVMFDDGPYVTSLNLDGTYKVYEVNNYDDLDSAWDDLSNWSVDSSGNYRIVNGKVVSNDGQYHSDVLSFTPYKVSNTDNKDLNEIDINDLSNDVAWRIVNNNKYGFRNADVKLRKVNGLLVADIVIDNLHMTMDVQALEENGDCLYDPTLWQYHTAQEIYKVFERKIGGYDRLRKVCGNAEVYINGDTIDAVYDDGSRLHLRTDNDITAALVSSEIDKFVRLKETYGDAIIDFNGDTVKLTIEGIEYNIPYSYDKTIAELIEEIKVEVENVDVERLVKLNSITDLIKEQMFEKYGYIEGLVVTHNGENIFTISANSLPCPIVINFDGSIDDESIVSKQIIDSFDNNINKQEYGKPFLLQKYINDKLNGDFSIEEIKLFSDNDELYLLTEYGKIKISIDDLNNPKNSKIINDLIRAKNIESRFKEESQDVEIQMAYDENGNVIYNYYINGEKYTATSLDDLEEDIYYNYNPSYTSNNKRLSRKQNKSITDVDEAQYNEMIDNFKSVDLSVVLNNSSTIGNKLDPYYKDASSIISNINKTADKVSKSITILWKLIDGIINLYIMCDYNMRQVLDGILTGKDVTIGNFVHSDGSFVDKMFKAGFSDLETEKKKFVETFKNTYNSYIEEVYNLADDMQSFAKNGVPVNQMDPNSEEYKYLESAARNKNYKINDIIKIGTLSDGTKYSFIDAEIYSEIFEHEIGSFYDGTGFSSRTMSDECYLNLISGPIATYMKGLETYTKNQDYIKAYRDMDAIKNYVGYLFDDGYRDALNEVRRTGEISYTYGEYGSYGIEKKDVTIKINNSYLTPAEAAMIAYTENKRFNDSLRDATTDEIYEGRYLVQFNSEGQNTISGRNKFVDSNNKDVNLATGEAYHVEGFESAIAYKLSERRGRHEAATTVYDMLKNETIDISDYLKRFEDGTWSGFTSAYTGIRHLIYPDNTSDEWKEKYIGKYISEEYDVQGVINAYNNGDISYDEYQMALKLTGSHLVKGSHKLSEGEQAGLGTSYSIGNTFGKVGYNVLLSWMLGPLGKGASTFVTAALKGLSKTGSSLNKTWNSMIVKPTDASWTTSAWIEGGITFLATWGSALLKNSIKSSYKHSGSSSASETSGANLDAQDQSSSIWSEYIRVDDMWGKLKEAVPGLEFRGNIGDYGIEGALYLLAVSQGKKTLPEFAQVLTGGGDGYFYDLQSGNRIEYGRSESKDLDSVVNAFLNPLSGDMLSLENARDFMDNLHDGNGKLNWSAALLGLLNNGVDVAADAFENGTKYK